MPEQWTWENHKSHRHLLSPHHLRFERVPSMRLCTFTYLSLTPPKLLTAKASWLLTRLSNWLIVSRPLLSAGAPGLAGALTVLCMSFSDSTKREVRVGECWYLVQNHEVTPHSFVHFLIDSIGMFPFKKRAVVACVHEASGSGDSQGVYVRYTHVLRLSRCLVL